jgi:hypothetical protein
MTSNENHAIDSDKPQEDSSPKSPARKLSGSSSPVKSPRNRSGSGHSHQDMSPRETQTKVQLVPARQHVGDHPSSPLPHTAAASESRPSADDLARKRAERFGIPVYQEMNHQPLEPMDEQIPEIAEVEMVESKVVEESERKEAQVYHDYDDLISSGIPNDSIVFAEDFVVDSANLKRIKMVIELPENGGETKVREIVLALVNRINTEFENDRSKIRIPSRLATSRLTFALKQALPRQPKGDNISRREKPDARDSKKSRVDLKSNHSNTGKKKNYDYVDDRVNKKNRSYSYDSLESDAEDFIRRNRLDKRSSEVMRTESRGMVAYIMDQGFNLSKYDNPSREVMLRVGEYRRGKKETGGSRAGSWNQKNRNTVRSPVRSRSRSYNRDRSRSRSVSYARNAYNRESRSRSR